MQDVLSEAGRLDCCQPEPIVVVSFVCGYLGAGVGT
jgi:hypothetical protein